MANNTNGTGSVNTAETAPTSAQQASFLPVLIGTGANAYGLACGFHKAYGVKSLAVGPAALIQCRHSSIVDIRVINDLTEEKHFVPELHKLATELKAQSPDRQLLIIACGDTSAALLAEHRDEIRKDYLTSTIDGPTLQRAVDKVSFWKLCETTKVNTPLTAVYSFADFQSGQKVPQPAAFPLELKAADSVSYLSIDFPGRKKAYTIADATELNQVAHDIYTNGYRGELIIQEFIPGDDTGMRTLNAYVNSDGSVAMMCMGRPVMEEYAPNRIGNYAAIISEGDKTVYEQCQRLIDELGYTGYVNFDIKHDPRDGSYRFFEINPRPGGSSDYVTQAGFNLARWIAEDLVMHRHSEPSLCFSEHLWMGIPKRVLKKYAPAGPLKDDALRLISEGKWSRSCFNSADRNLKRTLGLWRWQLHVSRDFKQYAPKRNKA